MEVMRIMVTSFKVSHAPTAALSALTLKQTTANPRPHWRLLDTHGQIWVSLLWDHCFFVLGPGVHKLLFVPPRSLFPQSCFSSGDSMVELMATSSKRAYAIPRSVAPRATVDPYLHRRHSNTQRPVWFSLCGVSWFAQGFA